VAHQPWVRLSLPVGRPGVPATGPPAVVPSRACGERMRCAQDWPSPCLLATLRFYQIPPSPPSEASLQAAPSVGTAKKNSLWPKRSRVGSGDEKGGLGPAVRPGFDPPHCRCAANPVSAGATPRRRWLPGRPHRTPRGTGTRDGTSAFKTPSKSVTIGQRRGCEKNGTGTSQARYFQGFLRC
jgi:hypothetical protein